MTVLVTGGSGLVGIHTAEKFAESGQNVICYNTSGRPWYAGQILAKNVSKVNFIKGDIQDFKRLKKIVIEHKIKGIIHAAAVVNEKSVRKDPLKAIHVNIIGTANVLEIAKLCKLKRVVYTSSGTIYGRRVDMAPIKEEEVNPQNFYSETKYSGEGLLEKYRNIFSVDALTVRVSSAYGPGKPWDTKRYPLQQLCWEAIKGRHFKMHEGGEYERDFTYIKDVALGIFLAYHSQDPKYTVYNICCGKTYSLSDVVNSLNIIVPGSKIKIGSGRFDKDFALSGSFRGPLDIQRAQEDLGFYPECSLETGLSEYVDFIQKNKDKFTK
jgi:nucleoside-diphosphate-sugar epimerase